MALLWRLFAFIDGRTLGATQKRFRSVITVGRKRANDSNVLARTMQAVPSTAMGHHKNVRMYLVLSLGHGYFDRNLSSGST